eukprot:SAG31_NODE_2741_length_5156_cov_3.138817_2_plen_90_part_00
MGHAAPKFRSSTYDTSILGLPHQWPWPAGPCAMHGHGAWAMAHGSIWESNSRRGSTFVHGENQAPPSLPGPSHGHAHGPALPALLTDRA